MQLNATNSLIISMKDEYLNMPEYVLNNLKNTIAISTQYKILVSTLGKVLNTCWKSYLRIYAIKQDNAVMTMSISRIVQIGNTLFDKYCLINSFIFMSVIFLFTNDKFKPFN